MSFGFFNSKEMKKDTLAFLIYNAKMNYVCPDEFSWIHSI